MSDSAPLLTPDVDGVDAPPPEPLSEAELRDLGFGSRVAEQSRLRLLNRDGTFNVHRRGMSFPGRLDPFPVLLRMRWGSFLALSAILFVLVNAMFAVAFLLAGPEALRGAPTGDLLHRFRYAFFFSVETFTTVGYGVLSPGSLAADVLMSIDAFVGVLATALVTGLLFARFSRPVARIAFSRQAVVAPYRGGIAFEFRMINQRRSQLSSLSMQVVLALSEERGGMRKRNFHGLKLERNQVAFFPLSLTVVHPIDRDSPLWGLGPTEVAAREAEFLVLITAIDDALSQTTHTRTSYRYDEIAWGARFVDMFEPPVDGRLRVDVGRLDEVEPVPLPVREGAYRAG